MATVTDPIQKHTGQGPELELGGCFLEPDAELRAGGGAGPDDNDLPEQQAPAPPKLTGLELIWVCFDSYTDACQVILPALAARNRAADSARKTLRVQLRSAREIGDQWERWFVGEAVKQVSPASKELRTALEHIARLKRQLEVARRVFGAEAPSGSGDKFADQLALARAVPISEVVVSAHVELRQVGRRLVARCPFHSDDHPSFYIDPAANRFYCFGCLRRGDAIDFVQMHLDYDFKRAVAFIATGGGEGGR